MREAVIVDSVRTPLGKSFRGSLNITRPDDILAQVIDELFTRHPELDKAEVQDVTIGCGFPEGAQGLNVARIAGVLAGLPTSVPGQTINRFWRLRVAGGGDGGEPGDPGRARHRGRRRRRDDFDDR